MSPFVTKVCVHQEQSGVRRSQDDIIPIVGAIIWDRKWVSDVPLRLRVSAK